MPSDLAFESPARLWAFAGLALAALAAGLVLRRRRTAEQYADAALRPSLGAARTGWRRRVAAAGLALGIVALTTAFARPSVVATTKDQRAVVVIALDVSTSMQVNDVAPNRFTVAKQTAQQFVRELPDDIDVGLVAYSAGARLVAAPTADHESVAAAVDTLTMDGGTAMGSALQLSLDAALRSLDLTSATAAAGSPPAARLVLLSDGDSTTGTPVEQAVQAVADAQIPVSTIGLGTESGAGQVFDGRQVTAPVNFALLQQIADGTGGTAYRAAGAAELQDVYTDIGEQIIPRTERRDVSDEVAGVGLVLLLGTAVPSLLWFGRLA
ncbi:VWA domain-containing protein [Motilibacter aurantiacus]|uniref:VWA domain-containing protein n=1 Tax=Motilibacter aurantiacus TaxID=2714955 RepID=UPI00140AADC8|nr:VWA domain-containing protein [Motilibacter aurantiacus]